MSTYLVTKNIIRQIFEDIATQHYQINSFGYGDDSDYTLKLMDEDTQSLEGNIVYPRLFLSPDVSRIQTGSYYRNYVVIVADLIRTGDQNFTEVESDTEQILLDVIAQIQDQDYGFVLDESSIEITPFKDRFADKVTGHMATISLECDYEYNRCQIPTEFIAVSNPYVPVTNGSNERDPLSWHLAGNSLDYEAFLGTTSNQAFKIGTNGVVHWRVETDGTISPEASADIGTASNRVGTLYVDTLNYNTLDPAVIDTGIVSLNGLTDTTQLFALGSSGTNPNIVSVGDTHTFNFPLAGSGVTSGTISNASQSLDGIKTFNDGLVTDYVQLDTTATPTPSKGMIFWDNDEETAAVRVNGIDYELGQGLYWVVKNQTGSQINKGTAVYAAGTLGASSRILVEPMIADGSIEAKYFLGIAAEDIADGDDGKVITQGKVRQIDTSAYNDGDVLWVSPTTAGDLTNVEPTGNNLALAVAFVVHAAGNGVIAVRVSNLNENDLVAIKSLNGLTDAAQLFAVGSSGTTPNISSTGDTHTFNFPLAGSGVTSGTISDGAQTIVGAKTFSNALTLSTITNAVTDTDKFLVSDSGVIKYRTGAEVRSDIGAGTGDGTVTSVALAAGTTGTDVNITGSPITGSGTITLNIPDASATARGLVTTGAQTIAGQKTFSSAPILSGFTQGSVLFAGASGVVSQDNANFNYGVNGLSLITTRTATVNNEAGFKAVQVMTARNTSGDSLFGQLHSATLNAAANSQVLSGFRQNLTYNIGAFTGLSILGFNFQTSVNATFSNQVVNTTNGTNSRAEVYAVTSGGGVRFGVAPSGNANSFYASRAYLLTDSGITNGLVIRTAAGKIEFDTANVTSGNISTSQNWYLGAGSLNASARLQVHGSGTTSATFTAQFHNSTGTSNSLLIRDDGLVSVNTLALPSFTQGSVLFAGAGGVVSENNSNLFWDSATNRLGVNINTGLTSSVTIGGTTPVLRLQESSGGQKRLDFSIDNSAIARISANQSASQLAFVISNTEALRINNSRNVLIGNTTGSARLHVWGAGTTSSTYTAQFHNSTGSSNSLVIRDNTFVGVGTIPSRQFHVLSGTLDNVPIRMQSGTTSAFMDIKDTSTTADFKVRIGSVGDNFVIYSGGFETLRSTSARNILIGNTSGTARLQVHGSGTTSSTYTAQFHNSTGTSKSMLIYDDGSISFGRDAISPYQITVNNDIYVINGVKVGSSTTPVGKMWNNGGVLSFESDSTRDIRLGSNSFPDAVYVEGTNGNVGIGTTTSSYALHVYRATGNVTSAIQAVAAGANAILRLAAAPNSWEIVNDGLSSNLDFKRGGISRLFINSSGNVGIGTTTPASRLEINIPLAASDGITINTNDEVYSLWSNSNLNAMYIANGPVGTQSGIYLQHLTGNVGIGLPASIARLHVRGSGTTSATNALLVQNSATTNLYQLQDDGRHLFNAFLSGETSSDFVFRRKTGSSGNIAEFISSNDNNIRISTTSAGGNTIHIFKNIGDAANTWLTGRFNNGAYRIVQYTGADLGLGSVINAAYFDTSGAVVFNAASVNASAQVQIDSTTKGFLPPRMTTAQKNAIASPAAGLMVYDTTLNKLCVYTTAWETITSV